MKRNFYSALFFIGLLLVGFNSMSVDKAVPGPGDCKCDISACPNAAGGDSVPCRYHPDRTDPLFQKCTCPWNEYRFFTAEDPRQRLCVDGPSTGDMSCDCKCAGTDAPDCKDCVTTCETVAAIAPDEDPCPGWNYNQYACSIASCKPKNPNAQSK